MDKRGQGLSTNAIILIILGVVVLVVLIIGFTLGWSRIAPWMSSDNVDTIVQQCGAACSTNSVYDYCSKKRELNDGTAKLKDVTCYYLSEKQKSYGVGECAGLCDNMVILDNSTTQKYANQEALDKVLQDCETQDKTLKVNSADVNVKGKAVYAISEDGKTLLNKQC